LAPVDVPWGVSQAPDPIAHSRRRQWAVVFRVRGKERTGPRQGAGARRVLHGTGGRIALCADGCRRGDREHYRVWANGHGLRQV